jgi:hypothetical protein
MMAHVDVYIHISLTSALIGGEWSASRPGRFTPPDTHWIGGWVGPRAGLDDVEKRKLLTLPGLELRPLGRPAHSQSLNRLRYPGSHFSVLPRLKMAGIYLHIPHTSSWHLDTRQRAVILIYLQSVHLKHEIMNSEMGRMCGTQYIEVPSVI